MSEKVTGDTLIAPSTEDYLADWLKGIAARNSPATLDRYSNSVKLFIKSLDGKAKKPVTATEAEIAANPRSRSAKLRAAERVASGE